MSKAQKIDMVVTRRWGFWNIILTALGIVIGAGIIIGVVGFLLLKLFTFVWPTLKWVSVVLLIATPSILFLYKVTKMPDNVARSHRYYQASLVCIRTLIILIILFADMRTV